MESVVREARALSLLATPVILTQVATMLMGVVDTLMVGRVSTEAMAAASLGSVWVWGTLVGAMGILMGLDPIISQAHGAGDGARCGLGLQRGLVLSLLLSPPMMWLWWNCESVLRWLGQDPQMSHLAGEYVRVQIWSVPAFFAYTVVRQYLTGRGLVRPAMWVAWVANVVNLLLNWVLIFGELGFAPRGVIGAGIATGISRAFMLAALFVLVRMGQLHKGAWSKWSRLAISPAGLFHVIRLGVPVGLQMSLEVWAFHAATLLAGLFGAIPLAAHSIVLNLASLSFMVPLGISIASGARVGNLIGAGDPRGAQRSAWVALGMGGGVMAISAAAFALLRWQIPRMYGVDSQVVALAAAILPIAAAFQVLDGTQAVGCGILRGMGAARHAAWINLAGYWAIGLPIGVWLAFDRDWELAGLWWGLTGGLAVVAGLLLLRVFLKGPEHARPLADHAIR